MSKTIGLQGIFFESENQDSNSTFYEVAIRVHGLGKNANGSDITNSAYESAVSTIKGIPIVAKFTEEVDSYGNDGDLTAHNQMIVKDNRTGGYVVKYDTVPLGFVHPEANITTEDVEESDGRIRTYIKADKVILWKRYEATQKIIEWLDSGIVPKVSMEIGNVNGQVTDGYFQIDSFEYESICALGSDVMPCFDKADIMQFESKDFNKLYQEMINEYEKGGEEVAENKEENIKEGTEKSFENQDNSVKGNAEEKDPSKKESEDFSLSNNNLEKEIRNELSKRQIEVEYWGWSEKENEFYLRDIKDNTAIVIDNSWSNYYGIPFETKGDVVTLDYDSKVEYVADWRPKTESDNEVFEKETFSDRLQVIKEKFEMAKEKTVNQVSQADFEKLKGKVEALETANKDLTEYKLNKEKEELRNEVDAKANEFEFKEDEIKELKEQAYNAEISVADFEKELFALMGRKALEAKKEFSLQNTEEKAKVKVSSSGEEAKVDELSKKYGKYAKYIPKNK